MLNKIRSMVFPKRCIICDEAVEAREPGICPDCRRYVLYNRDNVCLKCGKAIGAKEKYCHDCGIYNHDFDSGRTVFTYDIIGDSIYRFKYMNRPGYAEVYAQEMEMAIGDWIKGIKPDAIVPVPLHKKRMKKRGYNQAELIASALSKRLDIPCLPEYVTRVKNTIPLRNCDRAQRQNNMKKAFIVKENSVKLDDILLIDDIFTTGSTIDSIARELKAFGVKRVYFAALASAGT